MSHSETVTRCIRAGCSGAVKERSSGVSAPSPLGSHVGWRAGGLLVPSPLALPIAPLPLPSQMSTSAWRAPTTATLMPSARTPPSPTSASASLATRAMGSTAKVGTRRPAGAPPRSDSWAGHRQEVARQQHPLPSQKVACLPSPLQTFYSCFLLHTPGLLTQQCTGMKRSGTVCAGGSCRAPSPALQRAAFARLGLPRPRKGLVLDKAGIFLTAGFPAQRLQNWVGR